MNDRIGSSTIPDGDELAKSLKTLAKGLSLQSADYNAISQKIMSALPPCVKPSDLVKFTGEVLVAMTTKHPDFANLAARWEISNLHERLKGLTFTQNLSVIRNFRSLDVATQPTKRRKTEAPLSSKKLISDEFYELALKHSEVLDTAIAFERDFDFSYFAWKTMCKSYLIKRDNKEIHETPQFLFMRVALAIHGPRDDIEGVLQTYDLMSRKYFIHASPTLFNAGTVNQYLSSCFLVGMIEDSIDGIYRTLHKTAMISKASGGVGIHVSNVRGSGSYISGSNGTSNGLVPMLRVFNNTARYVDQGGNKRPGAFCIYLEPWHSDVFDFLQLRKNQGKEELRARDLFCALWIPDLFMKRVQENGNWSLFSPDEAPGLQDCFGRQFDDLYEHYEQTQTPAKTVLAQSLWSEILQSQVETGGPFMLYKDACNKKSNQQNLGTIKSSNLCCEIVQYSSPEETAVCNLASVGLPSFVKVEDSIAIFDFEKLHQVVKIMTTNLDIVIDICDYPVKDAEYSNKRNRPLAIGVQGMADVFYMLRIPFQSESARILNRQIFETMYHAAVEMSIELSKKYGPYLSFKGSPISRGKFQFDLWGLDDNSYQFLYTDWDHLRNEVQTHGMRNSLLIGPMPTASTSQILGFVESFEPLTSNIYVRRVLSGEFTVVNKYMIDDFYRLGIWDEKLKNRIIANDGSIQDIEGIPTDMKELYKTVWEIPQRVLIDLAADRGPFIDQSQSLNLYLKEPTMGKLTSMHFYAWKKGLKTGMYYLRTQAASRAIKFSINAENTLNGPVSIPEGAKIPQVTIKGNYLQVCDPQIELKSPEPGPVLQTPGSRTRRESFAGRGDVFGIHDSTPIACTTTENPGASCESCSG
ncbi:LANO_0H14422g1_1 [Lachancea nothofagi CBS 11611]|uniref:Ribonucleoside-diphosphate reductase n=1 Tax=Lachancea nothofagi CBS 11611 TaxID=1266666 RepID=A0A1G4KMG7_9SACH|nr:LANO_0H14422g1_1 [Lachancea nothofagi CBS 11611]